MCIRSARHVPNDGLIRDRFGNFFNHVDNFPDEAFLFVTSGGIEATKPGEGKRTVKDALVTVDASDSEVDEDGLANTEDGEG